MPLTPLETKTVAEIKSWVGEMLAERAGAPSSSTVTPSRYWSSFCDRFAYLLGMKEEYYDLFRLHTYHLDGDNYQTFYFGDVEQYRRTIGYDALIADTPARYRLSAPPILGEYGYNLGAQIVNNTIARLQRSVNTFVSEDVFGEIESAPGRHFILEIGGGYGCLPYHMNRMLPNTTYVILDLPETLLFSGTYLSIGLPEKKIYRHHAGAGPLTPERASGFDFLLVPNYALSLLDPLQFDLAINIASFQEMTPAQLSEYLAFLHRHARVLYSMNQRVQDKNAERLDVTAQLAGHFRLKRIAEPFRWNEQLLRWKTRVAHRLNLREAPPNRHEEYLCRPI